MLCIFFVFYVVHCSLSTFCFVDLTPWCCFFMCPCCVSSEFGKCFLTAVVVSPGHVTKFPVFIASNHVSFTGNPAAVWRYHIDCGIIGKLYTLLTISCFLACPLLKLSKVLLLLIFFLWALAVHRWWWWWCLLCGSLPFLPLGEILLCIRLLTSCLHWVGVVSGQVIRPLPSPHWSVCQTGVLFVRMFSVWRVW